jgi:hypothetical protein
MANWNQKTYMLVRHILKLYKDYGTLHFDAQALLELLAYDFAKAFQLDNPKFNPEKFLNGIIKEKQQ